MRLVIRDTPCLAAEYVAAYIADRIKTFAPSPSRPFVLGLPTGNSPLPIYRALITLHKAQGLSFKNVVTFNMDSYCGLPVSHPASYHSSMYANFFRHVDILSQNVHLLDGNATDYDAECAAYEAKMQVFGGVEMWLGGVGEDGHVAFNEPGSSLASRTRVEVLADETRIVNGHNFDGTPQSCPEKALTVGLGTLLDVSAHPSTSPHAGTRVHDLDCYRVPNRLINPR
jgi:glucosamine-6-phosphate deaminase